MTDVRYLLNDEAVCPHCDHEQMDSWEIAMDSEGEWIETDCGSCGKPFLMERVVDVRYSTKLMEDK